MASNKGRKIEEAQEILSHCIGKNGVWASPYRYKYQCWTRDFVIAAEDLLLNLGQTRIVKRHIYELAKRQKPNGQIPIMFLDNTPRWLYLKIKNSLRGRRLSFLLRAHLSRGGIGALSPWTRDSEILFVLGVLKYAGRTGDRKFLGELQESIGRAISYIEENLVRDGLVYGVDWRDTRPDLDGKFLLSNNCLLYRMYSRLGEGEKALAVKERVNQNFWNGTYYRDHPDTEDWDTLGNALAIFFGLAPQKHNPLIFRKAGELNTPFGYKINNVILPPKNKKEAELMKRVNQFGVIWPFVNGFMILAAAKAGYVDLAKSQFEKWDKLEGFFEWYDPVTGEGFGSPEQIWSAALYLRCAEGIRMLP